LQNLRQGKVQPQSQVDKIKFDEQNRGYPNNRIKQVTPAKAGVSWNQEFGDAGMRRDDSPRQYLEIFQIFHS